MHGWLPARLRPRGTPPRKGEPPARRVKSASRPISTDEQRRVKEKRDTPEGKVDKHGTPVKFMRDIESDWTIKNEKAHYGLKEHAAVDVESGFILATTLTPASASGPEGLQTGGFMTPTTFPTLP